MSLPSNLTWRFPLPRTHTGIALANGVMGLLVWGDATLNITVARAGFWDHRGGNDFAGRITFRQMRDLLAAGQEARVREIFRDFAHEPGQPRRPQQIGGGRLELALPDGLRPLSAGLDLPTAALRIRLTDGAEIVLRQAMDAEVAWLELPAGLVGRVGVTLIPAWHYVGEKLSAVGCRPPETWADAEGGGFCERLPADPALALAWCQRGDAIVIATALGEDPTPAATRLAATADLAACRRAAEAWWRGFWASVPRLDLPDPLLTWYHTYGLVKLAGATSPRGIPATLQGPWMEEYQLPPWSNDYHFNINVQEIYWPAYSGNRPEHLAPLWRMIRSWFPQMRDYAQRFLAADDALMLPHAVDDRCQTVGQAWCWTVDQATIAWVAQMAWQHYRYTLDQEVLREVAWPLLVGAFNGFWAMLERTEGEAGAIRFSYPFSVSPEYGECQLGRSWGRDTSFWLAATHFLVRTLPRAAAILGEPTDPRWAQVEAELPPYTTVPVYPGPFEDPNTPIRARIGIWQGQDLDHSHRHHSHLAGIYPFETLEPDGADHAEVIRHTLAHWFRMGAGEWSAWCLPWAAILMARCGYSDAAVLWLRWLADSCGNEGGSLSIGGVRGTLGSWGGADEARRDPRAREIMQLDANLGIVAAIHELLVQSRRDGIVVLPEVPYRWPDFSFDGIRAAGAFLIGATVCDRQVEEVRITSLVGGPLRLTVNLGPAWTADGRPMTGNRFETETAAGQTLVLRRARR